MVAFNVPFLTGTEPACMEQAIQRRNLSGEGHYTKRCQTQLTELTNSPSALLTPSCTHALELVALLLDLEPGDEVIMPSFTFVSTANAFVLRGAVPVFVDIRPDTMNIDEQLIEAAITKRTRAIVVMHYAGVACEMDAIMATARRHQLIVVEDAAQCIGAHYRGRHLGSIGHFGTFSFHSTKNIHCGEGGALLINEPDFVKRAEIIREKGTNRKQFLRGEVDRYSWVHLGSSILPGELNAAFLWAQLTQLDAITAQRRRLWQDYYEGFATSEGEWELPTVPETARHNGHLFYLKCRDGVERQALIQHLKRAGIQSTFHYVPLHTAPAGQRYGRFVGPDRYTTHESERLLRLPLYPELTAVPQIIQQVQQFTRHYEGAQR
ncbi:MAG: dTDP-4-amino-4,6-dideoxygalactose transaminase [Bacteroidota bacterium]